MSEPSDWEPLSETQRTSYPGEVPGAPPQLAAVPALVAPQRPASLASTPKAVHKPTPALVAPVAQAPDDPAVERALQELKSKISKASGTPSLFSQVQRRELREQQKLRAAHAPSLAECKPVQSTILTKDLALDVEYESGEHGRDLREEQPWFQSLPEAERERLHTSWAQKREQAVQKLPVQRRNQNHRTTAAIVAFVVLIFVGTGAAWHATLGAGIVCGIVWRYVSPCRFRDPLIAFGCLLGAQLIAWLSNGAAGLPGASYVDGVLLVAFAAIIGFDGEIKRTGGFDAK